MSDKVTSATDHPLQQLAGLLHVCQPPLMLPVATDEPALG